MQKLLIDFELERKKDLYEEKNDYLDAFFERVSTYDFYRVIFPVGSFERKGHFEDEKANGIAVTIPPKDNQSNGIAMEIQGNGRARRYTVTDDLHVLETFQDTDFAIISPISYLGNRRCGRNAWFLYALVFDLDGVGMPQLRDTLHQMKINILPKATFIVNSGTGLHLYYVLERPIPMYPQNQKYLKEMKYALTRQIWNRFTSTIQEPQMQGIMQGFRVVGSGSKLGRGYPVVAFRYGDKIRLKDFMDFIPATSGERQHVQSIIMKSRISLDEAKEKYPDWYERRVIRKAQAGHWIVKRDLYDWWLRRIREEIRVGHRYYGIMTLAIYAKKCGIDEDELRRDAYSLLQPYDSMSVEATNHFTEDDLICALEMYHEDYVTFPRNDISKLSGLEIPANKRNGRKQADHLKRCRIIQAANDIVDGTNWRDGNGRPTVQRQVCEWRQQHPDGKKAECHRETGFDPKTIRKWWDSEIGEDK